MRKTKWMLVCLIVGLTLILVFTTTFFQFGIMSTASKLYSAWMIEHRSPFASDDKPCEWVSDDGRIRLVKKAGATYQIDGTFTYEGEAFDVSLCIGQDSHCHVTLARFHEDPITLYHFAIYGEFDYPATTVCEIRVTGTYRCSYYQEGDTITLRKVMA